MITFQREPVIGNTEGWQEAMPLFLLHHEELESYDYELDIDIESYERMAQAGILRYYTAREDEKLIGYGTYIVSRPLRFNAKVGLQDVFFLLQEYRTGITGARMLQFMEKQLEEEGVEITQACVDPKGRLGKMLPLMGYRDNEVLFTKRLGD